MTPKTLAQTYDLSRSELVERLHQRLQAGDRTKLSNAERTLLIQMFIDTLITMAHQGTDTRDAIERLCKAEIDLLEQAYPLASMNSFYLPKYTKAVRDAIADGKLPLNQQNAYTYHWTKRNTGETGTEKRHHALDFLVYDPVVQVALRSETTRANNLRQDNMKAVELDPYIDEIQLLLKSADPIELIIGIAGATGRRHTEVVSLGQFVAQDHPYLLHFAGQQKKAEAVEYDILTLLPAAQVRAAIDQLRSEPEFIAIAGRDAEDPAVKRINSQVNRATHRILGKTGLVPVLEGFQSVSIHRLRGLYGAIAIHYFCPQHQREHRFLQHYLGHVIDGEIAPNSRATDHYFHYVLTRNGQPLRARGVKIPSTGLLPAMQREADPAPPSAIAAPPAADPEILDEPATPTPHSIPPTEADPMPDPTVLATLQSLQRIAEHQAETIHVQASTIAELGDRIQRLETQLAATSQPQPAPHLAHQADAYRTKWLQTLDSLNQIRQAMNLPPLSVEDEVAQATSISPEATPVEASEEAPETPIETLSEAELKARVMGRYDVASPYDRAREIWRLTQQWNQAHPEEAILINQSILSTQGIHKKAVLDFLADFTDEIAQENQRIGVTAKNRRSFNRGKTDKFADFLEKFGL